ncbi:MAG: tetratricopeptide repeat protein [Candidatus Omnitrophota bacterium]
MSQIIKSCKDNKDHLAIILIVAVSIIIYFNGLGNPFVFDDLHTIVRNNYIKEPNKIALLFNSGFITSSDPVQGIRPLLMLSFAFNYFFGGFNPIGYHITNIMFHFLNGIVLFFLLKFFLRENYFWPAFLSALLFIVHPVNTEAVGYISCRSSLMAGFFILLSLLAYVSRDKFAKPKDSYLYAISLISFIFALLSKEIAIVTPAILLSYDFIFNLLDNKKSSRNRLRSKLKTILLNYCPFILISILYLLWRKRIFGGVGTIVWINSPYSNLLTQIHVTVLYFRLLFFPFDLNITRHFPVALSIFEPSVFVSALITIILLGIALFCLKRIKLLSFAIFWFYLNLVPKFIVSLHLLAAEHHLYLPSIGFYVLFGLLIKQIFPYKKFRLILLFLLAVILLVFSITSMRRNIVWQNEYNLWQASINNFPTAGAYNNLALRCITLGKFNEAIEYLEKALKLDKEGALWPVLYSNLGQCYLFQKKYDKAEIEYKKALILDPELYETYNNLGIVYDYTGKIEEAIVAFKKAGEGKFPLAEAYHNLGITYMQKGKTEEAIIQFKKALERDRDFIKSYQALALLNEDLGHLDKAQDAYNTIIKIDSNNILAHYGLGNIYGKQGNLLALKEFNKAIETDPEFAPAHYNLAVSYANLSPPKIDLARKHLDLAIKYGYKPKVEFVRSLETLESKKDK